MDDIKKSGISGPEIPDSETENSSGTAEKRKGAGSGRIMWYLKKIYTIVGEFITKIMRTNIAANSGQVSYMLILAFFPFFIFLFSFLKYTPVTEELLIQISDSLFPDSFQAFIHNIINSLYQRTGMPTISITIVMLIWLASRATLALIVGLDNVYEVRNPRAYVKVRLLSMIYTVLFAVLMIFSLTALVFGNSLINLVIDRYPPSRRIMVIIRDFKSYVSYIILFIVFSLMYRYMPNHYYNADAKGTQPWISTQRHRPENKIYWVTWRGQIPGTVVAVAGWGVFSYIYSIYVSKYSMYSKFYGTMTTIALLMVWLYFCMYIFFVGGLLNSQLKKNKDIRMLRKMMSVKRVKEDSELREEIEKADGEADGEADEKTDEETERDDVEKEKEK